MTNTRFINFSNTQSQDLFELVMVGDSVLNSQIYFTIVSNTADTLFHEEYSYESFVPFENYTNEEKKASIIERFNNFFSNKAFITPAIPKDAQFSPSIPEAFWTEKDI